MIRTKEKEVPVIVFTGGPCSGKTTMLAYISESLNDLGFKVFVVPEVATLLIQGGVTPWEFPDFQRVVLDKITKLEKWFRRAAQQAQHQKCVILCDRGTMDGVAYMGHKMFKRMIEAEGLNIAGLRDRRYQAVIHLRTAALGAEKFYTLENNKARTESPRAARILDERTLQAWVGHPHVRVVENTGGFSKKKKETLRQVCRVLGIPEPVEIERKYLIQRPDFSGFPVPYQTVDIVQYYLRRGGRIRQRSQHGGQVYYHTIKRAIAPGIRSEVERIISRSEFLRLLNTKGSAKFRPVRKKRHCFVWRGQYFELDAISSPKRLHLLEIELMKKGQRVSLPPFIKVIREVTDEKQYSNQEIARIGKSRP